MCFCIQKINASMFSTRFDNEITFLEHSITDPNGHSSSFGVRKDNVLTSGCRANFFFT